MAQIHIHKDREYPEAFRWQVLSFKRMTWPEAYTGERSFDKDIYPEEYQAMHFTLAENDNVISHVEIARLMLGMEDETYMVWALGGVLTYPAFRNQGFGSKVVLAASEYIRQSGADLGLLMCAARLTNFYHECGWEPQAPDAQTELDTTFYQSEPVICRMALFVTPRAVKARDLFLSGPLSLTWVW
jgi:GNAT superfamily N-acetyltransferase